MSYRNYFFRKFINGYHRLRLKNKEFSLFSSNCNGGCICHDLGLRFRSPFVNLYLSAEDYLRFLLAPEEYLREELVFLEDAGVSYPVARLKDLTLHFMHYETPEEARRSWERRKQRVNWDNLFVLMTDKDGCNDEILRAFDALPYRNKVIFTHVPRPDIPSAVYIPGFEGNGEVGNCDEFVSEGSGRKYYDYFDYVKWFNEGYGYAES